MTNATAAAITPDQAKTIADAGVAGFRVSNGLIKMALDGLHDDHWVATTHEGGNNIIWTIGHLAVSHAYFAKMAGNETMPSTDFEKLFTMGSEPKADLNAYPSRDDVVAEYEKSCASFIEAWSNVDPETVTAKPDGPMADLFPAKAHLSMFAGQHEMTHAGQILMIRRMLGLPRVIG